MSLPAMSPADEASFTVYLTDVEALHDFAANCGRFLIRHMKRMPEEFKGDMVRLWMDAGDMTTSPRALFKFCMGCLFALEEVHGLLGDDPAVRKSLDGLKVSPGAEATIAGVEWLNLMGFMGEPLNPEDFKA